MSNLATLRAAIRIDLQDEDSSNERWPDATLDRHVKRALRDFSFVSPLEQKSTLQTESSSRDIDVSGLTPRIRVVAVEYPTGEYPPSYVPFSVWGDTVTLDLIGAPSGTPDVAVYWHKVHSINGTVTFSSSHDDIIATGAAGYAALEWASFSSNRLNIGGDEVWGRYMEFANVRLAAFREQLRRLPEAGRARSSRLYVPVDARFTSQATDPGPV
ncbi:MAG: hypothetical protein WD939_04760 [Dehalococcoidia bacterium]